MDRQSPPRGEDVPHRRNQFLVIIQQDVPGGGSHEQFESDDQRGEHAGVDPRGDGREQSVVGHGLPADGRLLLLERTDVGHGRLGVGHVVDAGDACVDGRRRPGAEILLRGHPGVAEVHVRIDETGDHDPAGPQVDPPLPSGNTTSSSDDAPVLGYPDLGVPQLPVDQRSSFQNGLDIGHRIPPRDLPEIAPTRPVPRRPVS